MGSEFNESFLIRVRKKITEKQSQQRGGPVSTEAEIGAMLT